MSNTMNKNTGELAAATNDLMVRIRETRKKLQGNITHLKDMESAIRENMAKEKEAAKAAAAAAAAEAAAVEVAASQSEASGKTPAETPAAQAADAPKAEASQARIKAETEKAEPEAPRAEPKADAPKNDRRRDGSRDNRDGSRDRRDNRDGNRTPRDPNAPRVPKDGSAPRQDYPFRSNGNNNGPRTPRDPNAPRAPRDGNRPPRDGGGFNKDRIPNKDKDAPAFGRGQARPGARAGARPSAAKDMLPSLEKDKERANTLDTKKKAYNNAHKPDEDASKKNKKTLAKEQAPGFNMDDDSVRGGRRPKKKVQPHVIERKVITSATITTERVTIKDLAELIGKPAAAIIKKLFMMGNMCTINSEIDYETAALIAADFDVELEQKLTQTAEEVMLGVVEDARDETAMVLRPPVVTVMGHVDHGKTSLLDAIRNTRVTATEAGGITQHIGAYNITVREKSITFIDTPGHAAFTSMRARGASITDVAILVVAADDGVMPQTVEAINHIKAANVPMIVAINKCDLYNANPDRVIQELSQYGVMPEEWGGDNIMVKVSAVKGEGIDELLDTILLVAEMAELKADPNARAQGTIVEAKLDRGRGPVATVLVQNGTLHAGDYVVAGSVSGRVRAMTNDLGQRVQEAGPAIPVEVQGWDELPEAGDILYMVDDEKLARRVAEERREKLKAEQMRANARVSLDDLFNRISEGSAKELRLVIKADVQGSAEAVKQSMERLSNDEVKVVSIHTAVGAITENDVLLASTSNAVIIGFNVRPDANGAAAAEREGVDVRLYRIIYNALEDVEKAMKGMLEPKFKEVILGHAEVRNVFNLSSSGTVAGSYVLDGTVTRNAQVRLLRDSVVIYEGKIAGLRRFKDDVKEVAAGYECGISLENYSDIKEKDVIEAFRMDEIKEDE